MLNTENVFLIYDFRFHNAQIYTKENEICMQNNKYCSMQCKRHNHSSELSSLFSCSLMNKLSIDLSPVPVAHDIIVEFFFRFNLL